MSHDEDYEHFDENENDVNNLSEEEAKDMLISYIEAEAKQEKTIKDLKKQIKELKKKLGKVK